MPELFRVTPPPCPPSLPLPPERLNWLLDVLGWARTELAFRLGVEPTTVAHWSKGTSRLPNRVAMWLETLAALHLALPLPAFWVPGSKVVGEARHIDAENPPPLSDEDKAEDAWTDARPSLRRGAPPGISGDA